MFSSFFGGSDKSDSPAYVLVDKATNELLIGPDWGVNVDLCDLVNSDFMRHGKDCVKALRAKMGKKNPKVQLLALTTLEMCMKNCGHPFHQMVADKEVLPIIVKQVMMSSDGEVKDKMLALVEEWSVQLQIPEFREAFRHLRSKGVEFPGMNLAEAAPMHTPPAQFPPSGAASRGSGSSAAHAQLAGRDDIDEADAAAIAAAIAEADAEAAAQEAADARAAAAAGHTAAYSAPHASMGVPSGRHIPVATPVGPPGPIPGSGAGGAVPNAQAGGYNAPPYAAAVAGGAPAAAMATQQPPADIDAGGPEAVAKLKADLDVAQNSVSVLADMLANVDPNNPRGVSDEVIAELAGQCLQMKPRVVSLIESVGEEDLLCAALQLNDELTKTLERHDQLAAAAAAGTAAPPAPAPQAPPPSEPTPPPPPAPQPAAVTTLDDLLGPMPETAAAAPAPGTTPPRLQPPPGAAPTPAPPQADLLDLLSGDDMAAPAPVPAPAMAQVPAATPVVDPFATSPMLTVPPPVPASAAAAMPVPTPPQPTPGLPPSMMSASPPGMNTFHNPAFDMADQMQQMSLGSAPGTTATADPFAAGSPPLHQQSALADDTDPFSGLARERAASMGQSQVSASPIGMGAVSAGAAAGQQPVPSPAAAAPNPFLQGPPPVVASSPTNPFLDATTLPPAPAAALVDDFDALARSRTGHAS